MTTKQERTAIKFAELDGAVIEAKPKAGGLWSIKKAGPYAWDAFDYRVAEQSHEVYEHHLKNLGLDLGIRKIAALLAENSKSGKAI